MSHFDELDSKTLSKRSDSKQGKYSSLQMAKGKSENVLENSKEKVMISGDDILIEYAERIVAHLKVRTESALKASHKQQILKFISHYVWH